MLFVAEYARPDRALFFAFCWKNITRPHQEKTLASAGYDSSTYGQAVYVPAASDRAVMAL